MQPGSINLGRTNFGILALVLGALLNLPLVLCELLPRAGIQLPRRINENMGLVFFDLGFIIDLLVLALGLFGVAQGGRNRVTGGIAIVLALLPWVVIKLL